MATLGTAGSATSAALAASAGSAGSDGDQLQTVSTRIDTNGLDNDSVAWQAAVHHGEPGTGVWQSAIEPDEEPDEEPDDEEPWQPNGPSPPQAAFTMMQV